MTSKQERLGLSSTGTIAYGTSSSTNIDVEDYILQVENPKLQSNPFVYDSTISWYEGCKIVLHCLFLIPLIRMTIVLVLLIVITFLATLGTIGHVSLDPTTGKDIPLPTWRRMVLYPLRWLFRGILLALGFYWIPVRSLLYSINIFLLFKCLFRRFKHQQRPPLPQQLVFSFPIMSPSLMVFSLLLTPSRV